MSILPVLGHKPITSYFSRASSTKRKKGPVSSSTGAGSKRPKQFSSSSFPSTPEPANIRSRTEVIAEGLKRANTSNRSPCTPAGNRFGNKSVDGTLPTPPMTCVVPNRSRNFSEKHASPSPQSSEYSTFQGDEPAIAPLSAPPQAAPNHRNTSSNTGFQPSETSASFLAVSDIGSVIPSSQSQDDPGMAVDMLTSFSQFSGKLSPLRPTEVEDLIVESSQSQLLIMAPPIVRKLELEPTLPAVGIVIPSSQDQEHELIIPTEKDSATGPRRNPLVRTAQEGIDFSLRTRSDESFAVPIQNPILDNIFSDEQRLDTPATADNTDPHDPERFADSETKDEHEEFPNSCFETRNLEHTSRSSTARASSVSQSPFRLGSYSSLPPEVWEFRKMFENGDESYPADFPESLRS